MILGNFEFWGPAPRQQKLGLAPSLNPVYGPVSRNPNHIAVNLQYSALLLTASVQMASSSADLAVRAARTCVESFWPALYS